MSNNFDVFPDSEAMVGTLIRADAYISGNKIGVYSSIPKTPTLPFIVIRRVGGLPAVRERLDRASLQIDVFGANKGAAYDLAAIVRTIILDAEGTTQARGFISHVQDELGMTFIPDMDFSPPIDRYTFGMAVFCHS